MPSALEVLVFHAASPPRLAATMGIHDRTARRLLQALEVEGYLERGYGNYRQGHTYLPTPRLLALAGQLAARLPLVTHGTSAVCELWRSTGLGAYLVVPSYGDLLVVARAGDHAPALWSLVPATESAGGHVLLAYRQLCGAARLRAAKVDRAQLIVARRVGRITRVVVEDRVELVAGLRGSA